MRKHLLLSLAIILGLSTLHANPVDVNRAQRLGQKFVQNSSAFAKSADNSLNLTYTCRSDNGIATMYVFNLDKGFVIVAADDCAHPILGYSNEGCFDINNAPAGMLFMLDELTENIASAISSGSKASGETVSLWENLEKHGTLHSHRGAPVVEPLIQTKWNQDSPYNLYVPAGCPTGCVATAMAQVMKYWEWPVQGTGEHSYVCPPYGEQYANFGETTYDWAHMTNTYNSQSTTEEREAVAVLMRHCGVAVDMMYETGGSGAYSGNVPAAVQNYFSYSDHTVHISRAHNATEWAKLLKSNIDQRIPIYYSGQSSDGGHAFICDGYDVDGLFHFNWGWGGSANNYFDIEGSDFDYSGSQAIVYDFVPNYVTEKMPAAPENVNVSIDGDVSLIGHLTWTNPSSTIDDNPLQSIEKVLVLRNGIVVAELEGQPGQTMAYDDEVPFFDQFEYTVCAVSDGVYGRTATTSAVFGPYCEWTVIMTSASFQGWNGGGITVQNAAGSYIDFLTTTTSSAQMQHFQMALGNNNLFWTEPQTAVSNLSFKVKDSQNQIVYEYSGPSSGLEAGLLRTLNNSCGNENTCEAPYNLRATIDPDNHRDVHLVWESDHQPEFGYCIYRDGYLFNMSHETEYVDYNTEIGGHNYYITALCSGGETENSNEYSVTSGEYYAAPVDLYFQYLAGNKVQICWEAPANSEVEGYGIWRKTPDTPYRRVKLSTATNYKDNNAQPGTIYQYAVVAHYENPEVCVSGYANSVLDANQFFVVVDWNPETGLLVACADDNSVSLSWQAVFGATTYSILRDGQEIATVDYSCRYVDENVEVGATYCYQVKVNGSLTNEVCVTVGEEPQLPCTEPTALVGVIANNVAHISWTAPADRTPNYYKVTRVNHTAGDATDEFQVTETSYDDELPLDGIDRSYSVNAVYDECESDFALTADGQTFVRLNNLGVNELDNVFRIYPNPTNGQIMVETQASQVAIYNLMGQLIEEKSAEDNVVVFDLSQLGNGVYVIKAGNAMQKVVKM